MQPTAPPAPPPAPTGNGQANYDFIFNDNKPGKKSLIPMGGGKKSRIIVVAAAAIILLFVIIIIVGLINNAGKADTESLVSAAKQQQELIRVSKIGIDKAKTQAAKNIAITTLLALESEQDDMQAAIETAGLNAKKVLVSSPNAKTDQVLTTAEQNNRFDEEFLSIMTTSLTAYQKSVKAAYDGATSNKLKAALTTQFNSANTLAGASKAE
jgi:hypothetical protein